MGTQAAVIVDAPPRLLLLDLVDVQAAAATGRIAKLGRARGGGTRAGAAARPGRAGRGVVFVRTASAAWAVTLAWLPALANFLVEGVAPPSAADACPCHCHVNQPADNHLCNAS